MNRDHVWILSNELGRQQTQEALRKLDTRGTLFIGTGCLEVLNLASLPRPNDEVQPIKTIIVFDSAEKVKNFWDAVYPMLVEEENADKFKDRFIRYIKREQWSYFPPVVPKEHTGKIGGMEYSDRCFENFNNRLDGDIEDGLSFLSKDPPGSFSDTSRYDKIHAIFNSRRFHFIPFDVCQQGDELPLFSDLCTSKTFWNYVSRKGQIDSCYASNIHECIDPEQRPAYKAFVETLPPTSIFIDARIQLWSPPNPVNMDDYSTQRVTCDAAFPTKPTRAYLKKREFAESLLKQEADLAEKPPEQVAEASAEAS